MQCHIAFDPELCVSADEFVTAWNRSEHSENAKAIIYEDSRGTFLSPEITIALITAAVSIPATIIASVVSEFFKKKYIETDSPKISTVQINAPDGTPILIVKRSEE